MASINFNSGEFIASANTLELRPLPTNATLDSNTSPSPSPITSPSPNPPSSLPSPPPVVEQKTSNTAKPYNGTAKPRNDKELIFTPASSTVSETPEAEPVPFLPQIDNSALGSNSSQVSSLSDVLGSASVKYKVLVEATDEYAEKEVRSLYPQAFNTVYQGESVLQIGAFNNWNKAKQAKRSLEDLGLDAYILE